jgi:hypothetical protein
MLVAMLIAVGLLVSAGAMSAQQLESLNVSYASVTGSRIPLWIAKDAGLFEKYGLHVDLVVIAAGNAAIGALVGGDVEILGAPGSDNDGVGSQGTAARDHRNFWAFSLEACRQFVSYFNSRTPGENRWY